MAQRHRVVLDTNTLLRGLANRDSASGRILHACENRRAILLLSRAVISEYRAVLMDDRIAKARGVSANDMELVLRRLRYFGETLKQVRSRFAFDRDPADAKFIELAIAGVATHLITCDNDLLSLESSHSDAARRFRQRLPRIHVLGPADYVRELEETSSHE